MVGYTLSREVNIQSILALNRNDSRSRESMIDVLALPPIPTRSGAFYLASATVPVNSAAKDLKNSTPEAQQMSAHAEAVGMVGSAKAEEEAHTKLIDAVSCVYLCDVCPDSFSHTVSLCSLGINPTALQRPEGEVYDALPESHT